MAVSPLQVAVTMAGIANGGKVLSRAWLTASSRWTGSPAAPAIFQKAWCAAFWE